MPGRIPERTIDEIRDRTDILSLVGKYVPLRKAGRNFVGLCPFHAEKTPSFSVNPEKGIYKCFGCGKGGNAITFLMEIEGMSFTDAVKELGDGCGIRVVTSAEAGEKRDDRITKLYTINEDARNYFSENLKTPKAKGAIDYLKKRGLDKETLLLFQIGYAPARTDALISHFRHMGHSTKILALAGLVGESDRGAYDRFRNRIIFPIRDHRERCVGFGGRIIGAGEPKYLNSPETPIYHKGEVLYGLSITREEIRKSGHAIIVEGYFDLIALFQAGIRNVAATLGTALTKDHLKLLGRYTREVVLLFDPDEAGIKAAERTLPLFAGGDIFARAAVLSTGEDPDDFIRNNGTAAFYDAIDGAEEIYNFCLKRIFERYDLTKSKDISLALEESARIISVKRSDEDRDQYVAKVSERLGIRDHSVVEKVNSLLKKGVTQTKGRATEEIVPKDFRPPAMESRLFKIAANFPGVLLQAGFNERHLGLFEEDVIRGLIQKIYESTRGGQSLSLSSLLDTVGDTGIRQELIGLSFIDVDEIQDESEALEIARNCIWCLEKKELGRKSREINLRLKEEPSGELDAELLRKKMDYTKNLKR